VHGGAWDIPDEALAACREGCLSALAAGWRILSRGGTAVEAAEAAIAALEDNPTFDAGIGSHLNRDGAPELDAILMEGSTLKAGAIAAVSRVRNPIRLARRVLEHSEHMFLVGAGAEQFAKEEGMTLCDPEELITETERAAWLRCRKDKHQVDHHLGHGLGTVGAVALDAAGEIAEAGGVSCTGWGEAIMRVVMAKTAIECLRHPVHPETTPADAAREAVTQLAKRGHGTGGLILLDRDGRPGFDFNTRRMAFGFQLSGGDPRVFV